MEIFAERNLIMVTAQGRVEVVARLGKPVPVEPGVSWKCPYEIWFGDECKSFAMHGIDSLQALQLSISILDVELEQGAKRRGGKLEYLDRPFESVLQGSSLKQAPT
jgi:hypothetical protein